MKKEIENEIQCKLKKYIKSKENLNRKKEK